MKRLYLSSSVNVVAKNIANDFDLESRNKLAFIKTASEVEDGDLKWLEKDRKALEDTGFNIFDYTITGKTKGQIEVDLRDSEYLFFSGGNTLYLLEKLQQSDSLDLFRDFVSNKGKIHIGSSAGSIIAGPDISPVRSLENEIKAPSLKGYKSLNLVNFVIFPHWGSPHFKNAYLNQRLDSAYEETKDPIIILNDYQYVKVEEDSYKIVEA